MPKRMVGSLQTSGLENMVPPRRMRSHVRRWIAEWDLQRLYPGSRTQLEEEELHVDYGEDVALEQVSDDATESDTGG